MDFGHSVRVMGVGGSGCAAVERMAGCGGCDLIVVHTDASSLLERKVATKILIGRNVTRGRSTGNNIKLGEEAALSDLDMVKAVLDGAKVTFVIAGLGGGTGAGASPIVAEAAKSKGSTVIAFVNIPFTAEGKVCRTNAITGLEHLKPYCDLIVVIENDRFLKTVPNLSIRDAFTKVNNMLLEAVRGMVKLIVDSGVENLKPMLTGYATLGYGASYTLVKAVEAALDSPLIGADLKEAAGVMLNFTTHSAQVDGLQESLDIIPAKTNNTAGIIWTNTVDDTAEGVEVIALFSGVKPAF
ncbi:MAG: cell division protein FtsZ [Candidatus Altiarchaeota archaeon]